MIEYVEIRDSNRQIIGIIDTAKSIIWHSVYFGVGDFEIYVAHSDANLELLQIGNFVSRADNYEVGIIEKLQFTHSQQDGDVIIASGRFAKSILDRRLIYNLNGKVNTPEILRGNVETEVRRVVSKNAIANGTTSARNFGFVELGAVSGITDTIVDEQGVATQKQVSYQGLLKYTDELLQEYGLSAKMVLNESNSKLQYIVFEGTDRSVDNTDENEAIIFSDDFDNLTSIEYSVDDSQSKNYALIGGAGEGLERFYALLSGSGSGILRREVFVDGSSNSLTYKDENDEEQTYTDAEYTAMLKAQAKQELSELVKIESMSGAINATFGTWVLNQDYFLGDIVTIQANKIGKYANVRITEVTEVQDENGYTIEAIFE